MTNDKRKMATPAVPRQPLSVICYLASSVWEFLRELSGEAACERQLQHAQEGGSRGELYQQHLEEKYSRPCRCC